MFKNCEIKTKTCIKEYDFDFATNMLNKNKLT